MGAQEGWDEGIRNHLFLALGDQLKKSQEINGYFREDARRFLDPPSGHPFLCESLRGHILDLYH